MRTHNKSFQIRFTEKEYETLCRRAKQTGLSKSIYIRFMIMGCCPKENPDDRFWIVMRQLIGISNNVNRALAKPMYSGLLMRDV